MEYTYRVRFFDAVVEHETALWEKVDAGVFAASGIRLGSLSALRLVAADEGQCRVQDIAAGLRITVGAASKIVDRLEGAALVRRHPHESDRRSSVVVMTDGGRRTAAVGGAAMESVLGDHLQGLPADQVDAVSERLRRLTDSAAGSHVGGSL